MAGIIQEKLLNLLDDPAIRLKFKSYAEDFREELLTNPSLQEKIESAKDRLFRKLDI